jgi:hypothetical protein
MRAQEHATESNDSEDKTEIIPKECSNTQLPLNGLRIYGVTWNNKMTRFFLII